jgi:hypothetical protein
MSLRLLIIRLKRWQKIHHGKIIFSDDMAVFEDIKKPPNTIARWLVIGGFFYVMGIYALARLIDNIMQRNAILYSAALFPEILQQFCRL